MNLPGDAVRVLVEGDCRGADPGPGRRKLPEGAESRFTGTRRSEHGVQALVRTTQDLFDEYARGEPAGEPETVEAIRDLRSPASWRT